MNARPNQVMSRFYALLLALSFALAIGNSARAQDYREDYPAFTQQELDQMLAPIALYPDSLLSQILMAATYPLEVAEADRWSMANRGLSGEQAMRAVERNNWDPSVKSLVAFPQILRMMSDKLDWTERLGDAFLDQETQVMDTVQDLRHRAYDAGNLRSNDRYRVNTQGLYISIDLGSPDFAYLPYYDPMLVYGPWWWPQYPPVYWSPWPGYRERAGYGVAFAWGAGITLGAEFFFGAFDWPQRRVNVVNVNNYYYPRNTGLASRATNTWRHEPDHRRGAPYRAATVRERFSPARAAPEARRDFRGRTPDAPVPRSADGKAPEARNAPPARPVERASPQPAAAAPATRPDARESRPDERGYRPAERNTPPPAAAAPVTRADTRTAPDRPGAPAAVSRPAVDQPPHALEGVGRGADERNASARGRASNQGVPRDGSVAPPQRARGAAAPPPTTERAAPPPPARSLAAPAPAQPVAAPPSARPGAAPPSAPQRAAPPRSPERARDGKGKAEESK